MKFSKFFSFFLVAVFLSAFISGGDSPLTPDANGSLVLQPVGEIIELTNSQNYLWPDAAAYSDKTDHYLVVYGKKVNDDDVYGRFVDASTGELTGDEFPIADKSTSEGPADVVYDPFNDVFLVVYMSGSCDSGKCRFVIKGRIVNEPELNGGLTAKSPLGPNEFTIADQDYADFTLSDPKVAYNQDDHQYLVVFERLHVDDLGSHAVYGRMLNADKELPVGLGIVDGFSIAAFYPSYALDPDVAWSGESGNFLAVVTGTDNLDADLITQRGISAIWLKDTYQSVGGQYIAGQTVAPNPLGKKYCDKASVAYDPASDRYTIVYKYSSEKGDGNTFKVYGQRVKAGYSGTGDPLIGNAIPIETDVDKYDPDAAPKITHSGPANEMQVVYTANKFPDNYYPIYIRSLVGSNVSPAISVYNKDDDIRNLVGVLSSSTPGNSIVAWVHEPLSGKNRIWAQRIITLDNFNYLPSIFKEK